MDRPEIVAISSEDNKQAALLFDRIAPMTSAGDVPESIRQPCPSFSRERVKEELARIRQEIAVREISVDFDNVDVIQRIRKEISNRFIAERHSTLISQGVVSVPLFHADAIMRDFLKTGVDTALQFTLTNVPIVDTSDVEWEQILDVRHDPDFRKKSARFRSFIDDSYKGKDARYIIEDLSNRIDAFERACKRHGLNLVLSTLSQVLNSKSLIGSFGMATAGILTGNPVLTAGGAVVAVGKAVLNISEKHIEFRQKQNDNPVSFLVALNKSLGPDKAY